MGPVTDSINNSGLGVIKRMLCGLPPFLGGERFLLFGTEMHTRSLLNKKGKGKEKWTPYNTEEEVSMVGGEASLKSDQRFQSLKKGAIIEKWIRKDNAFGIHAMHGTLDINNKKLKLVVDVKTTSCETEEDFIEKAIKLGYPRQGVVYEELSGNTASLFVGISKKAPFKTFYFDLNDFQAEKQLAKQEAEFLLTFFKTYGFPIDKHSNKARYIKSKP